MGLRQQLEADRDEILRKLAILNGAPEDTFPFGTIVVFAPASGNKWYYVKIDEESWISMKGGNVHDLAYLIFQAVESSIGYFEVYVLNVEPNPIYASA